MPNVKKSISVKMDNSIPSSEPAVFDGLVMSKENSNQNELGDAHVEIEEMALLLVSKDAVGVTDNMEDVISFIEDSVANGRSFHGCSGSKEEMLSLQHYLLLADEVKNSYGADELRVPERKTEYNITCRNIEHDKIPVLKLLSSPLSVQ